MRKVFAVGAAAAVLLVLAPSSAAPARGEVGPPRATETLTSWDGVLAPTYDVLESEWWYTIGFLSGTNQAGQTRHFGFMVSVVRSAAAYVMPFPVVLPIADLEVSLLDLDGMTHVTSIETTGMPDPATFSVRAEADATHFATRGLLGPDGALMAHFVVGGANFALDLVEQPQKNQSPFGKNGVVHNDSLGDAIYVSRTRQQIVAPSTIRLGAETIEATGLSWEDHQVSGVNPFRGPVKWNWFAILLRDGTEVMAYQIVDAKTDALLKNYAAHVLATGDVDNLDGQLVMSEGDHADYKGIAVPTSWQVALPSVFRANLRHAVPLPDIPTTFGQVQGAYFEGPCVIAEDDGAVLAAWAEYFDGRLYHGPFASGRLP